MKKSISKLLILSITATLVFTPGTTEAAKKSPKLSAKTLTITEGKNKNVTVKNATKSVSWSIKTGKKNVKIKKLNKKTVRVTAVKKGKAKLQCKVGAKKLICNIVVKGKKVVPSAPVVSAEPTVSAEATAVPTNTPRPTHIPTEDCLMPEPAKYTEQPKPGPNESVYEPVGGGRLYYFFGTDILRKDIEEMRFVNTIQAPQNPILMIDVSQKKNKSVMAWITDEDKNGAYEATIGQEGGVVANEYSWYLCSEVSGVTGFENLYTDGVKDMSYMFNNFDLSCRHQGMQDLYILDLGDYFDTSNVQNMNYMFKTHIWIATWSDIGLRLGKSFVFPAQGVNTTYMGNLSCKKLYVSSEKCKEYFLRSDNDCGLYGRKVEIIVEQDK